MKKVILPKQKIFDTPRVLRGDAYTIGSEEFESDDAKIKSVYYLTFRRLLKDINPVIYKTGDNRIIFVGFQRILERLLYKPVTHEEIDSAKEFLSTFKATTRGLKVYRFPEELWRRVVDEFDGYPPIKIRAMREGSVVYPHEPVVIVENTVEGFGQLAAWFESKILQLWGTSERVTQDIHFAERLKEKIREVDPDMSKENVDFLTSISIHDFGDRAGLVIQESEDLGMVHLYTFSGTDTVDGAYQAWMNADKQPGIATSVYALAHRNVQSFDREQDCYNAIYESSEDGDFCSMVADCYNFKKAVKNYLLPLAIKSRETGNGKIVVARPDSDDPIEQILFVCNLAVENGLYETKTINGKEWKFATYLRFLEGDGMGFDTILNIIDVMHEHGFAYYGWGLFGVGGGLRNSLKRDNLSAKYALCAKGADFKGVCKYGEEGKSTLPGYFKVLRNLDSLENKESVVLFDEQGEDQLIEYYSNSYNTDIVKPFAEGQDDNFLVIKKRINEQFESMPKDLTRENTNFPASVTILNNRKALLEKYKYEI